MPRSVKIQSVTWVEMYKPMQGIHRRPVFGDCVGIYEITDENILETAMKTTWRHHFCFAIEQADFETLLAFGIPLLDPKEKPPCTKPG
jgi:hypothetical protein